MAGSPRYLTLLNYLFEGSDIPRMALWEWKYLDQRWYHVTQNQSPYNLKELAKVSYALLARGQKKDISAVIQKARELHVAKNAGYAGAANPDPWANFRLSELFGISPVKGVFVRMSDKYARITSLRADASNERVGESLWDTLADLAAYALIAVCLLEEERATEVAYHPV